MFNVYNYSELDNYLKRKNFINNQLKFSFKGYKQHDVLIIYKDGMKTDYPYYVSISVKKTGCSIYELKSEGKVNCYGKEASGERYSSKTIKELSEGLKKVMKDLGFKEISKPTQLELDVNQAQGQLSLDDIDTEGDLKKELLKEKKEKDFKEQLDKFFDNPYDFIPSLITYIKSELGYEDTAVIDSITIKKKSVLLEGIFRKETIKNVYETNEPQFFPGDEAKLELDTKDIILIISYSI